MPLWGEKPITDIHEQYERWLWSLLPKWYHKREGYRYSTAEHRVNATQRPPTTVPILDMPGPSTVHSIALGMTPAEIEALCERERQEGLHEI